MLPEIVSGLAGSGATALISAAGTDAWTGVRTRVVDLLRRGGQQESAVLRRLDQTVTDLGQANADGTRAEEVRSSLSRSWQTRFTDLLEDLPEAERDAAVAELEALVKHVREHTPDSGARAGNGGQAVAGDMHIQASGGSMAAGVVHGGMHMGPPGPKANQD
ncbi:hypothetical protein [Streptomyces sp. NBC_00063]|uniref:hypothetical protein n=1 Tax=Streptomyces sp. NBC_00063 TaxID=2975638 RepID=UPI003D70A551